MFEVDRVERLDEWQIEYGKIDRRLVSHVAVVVPGVDRGEHHVAGPEGDVLATDTGEIAFSGQAEPDGVGGVPVRRHHLVGVIEPVGGVHRAHGRAPRGEPRIDQDERAALGIVHRHQFRRSK